MPTHRPSLLLAAALLAGCASQGLVSSWKAHDAQPLELDGAKVAAVVMMQDQALRRLAEDALVREVTERGAVGIPMYSIYPDPQPSNEPRARAALEQAGVQGVVVMRPASIEKDVVSTPVTSAEPMYREYWGAYYGAGWSTPYGLATASGGDERIETTVYVEMLVYSLEQNKLVWSGRSRLSNPSGIERTVAELARTMAEALEAEGLLERR